MMEKQSNKLCSEKYASCYKNSRAALPLNKFSVMCNDMRDILPTFNSILLINNPVKQGFE